MGHNECHHNEYDKEHVEEKWTGHTVCLVKVRRTCKVCGYSQEDWEFGNHEGYPRMLPDDTNFFVGCLMS